MDQDKRREDITCPLCGCPMVWGIWAVAEVPDSDELIEGLCYFCTPVTEGCCATLQLGIEYVTH